MPLRQNRDGRAPIRSGKLPEPARAATIIAGVALWILTPAYAANGDSHVRSLADDLQVVGQASFSRPDGTIKWRLEQSFRQGEAPCIGETYQHEELEPTEPDSELLWDRHIRRTFNLGRLIRLTVKPGAQPNLYATPAKLLSGIPDAYTVTLQSKENDIQIRYHGFDGGRKIAEDAPLFFSTYYHDLFVVSRRKAIDAAMNLRTLAVACGADNVTVDDLTEISN